VTVGRHAQATVTLFLKVRSRSWPRTRSGAVSMRLWSWLAAAVRARRRKLRRGQDAAEVVDHRSDVHVLVSIHAAENPAPDT
jgi:hypothetical protein